MQEQLVKSILNLLGQLSFMFEKNQGMVHQIISLLQKPLLQMDANELVQKQEIIGSILKEVKGAQIKLKGLQELVSPLEKELALLQLLPPTEATALQISELKARLVSIASRISDLKTLLDAEMANLYDQVQEFQADADPRLAVELLSDDLPFLLLPVRLETRFMVIKHVKRIEVDGEQGNAVQYAEVNTKHAIPEVQRLRKNMSERIEDLYELWVRIYPDDIAVATHEERLTQDEYDAAFQYWVQVWRAGGDQGLELGAWRSLANSYRSRRAAWIAKQTEPQNPGDKPLAPVADGTPLSVDPVLPGLSLKPNSWTEMPQSNVMPDRFVVRVYTGSSYREVLGSSIPNPLPVGLDPSADYSALLDQQSGILNMPPEIKWLSDFEAAVSVGMGIRIPLSEVEMENGFDRMLVLGLRLMADALTNKEQLEALIDGHHYKSGFALLAQGSPTNNSDNLAAGFSSTEPGEEMSFAVETREPLFTATPIHSAKKDGQRFTEALGISNNVLAHVYQSNGRDGAESICMNKALWPATMGYYMKQMLSPSVSATDIATTKNFFNNYVHGRGLVPAFRVGKQPYGVHPATVYSRWKYIDKHSYQSRLYDNILMPLNRQMDLLIPKVASVNALANNASLDPKAVLLDMLGLHPSSVEYHQRFTAGSYFLWNMQQFVAGRGLPVDPNFPNMNGTQSQAIDATYRGSVYSGGLGFFYNQIPRIFSMTFMDEHRLLNGPVIDKLPLSETRSIQNIPNTIKNYIEWLRLSTLHQVRQENFTNIGANVNQKPPQALLYLLLRHACFLEYLNVSYGLLIDAGVISAEATIDNELLNLVGNGQGGIPEEVISSLRQTVVSELTQANEYRIAAEVTRLMGTNGATTTKSRKDFENQLRLATTEEVERVVNEVFNMRLATLTVDQAKWNYLTQPVPEVSGDMAMEEYIDQLVDLDSVNAQALIEFRGALNCISLLPTARLERCVSEHLDCCSYRLDAWMTGLVTERLDVLRSDNANGIYLGGYSILENVRPGQFPGIHAVEVGGQSPQNLGAGESSGNLQHGEPPQGGEGESALSSLEVPYSAPRTFSYLGSDPFTQLIEDPLSGNIVAPPRLNPSNEGYILAPSLTHAVTAAILRAGYIAHRNTASNDDALAVNLTSARVRKALYYLEGIRNGNSLNALLGYQFERGLHDAQVLGAPTDYALDGYILDIRLKYPMVAGGVVADPTVTNINDAEARNVTDALALIEAYRKTTAPFWDDGLTIAAPSRALIVAEIEKLISDIDGIGDLLLSESVFQTARGNHERAGAVLKAMGEGNAIPEPEIIKTPRQNHELTHRFAIQLNPATASETVWSTNATARSFSEPALNTWFGEQLPQPQKILTYVEYKDNGNALQSCTVSLEDLQIEPIDLVSIFATAGDNSTTDGSEISTRILLFVRETYALNDTNEVRVLFSARTGFTVDERNLFELLPLLRGLAQLVGSSRELRAEDLLLPSEVDGYLVPPVTTGVDTTNLLARLTDAVGPAIAPGRRGLQDVLVALAAAESAANALVYPPVPGPAAATLDALRLEIVSAASFGIDGSIPLYVNGDSKETRDALVNQSRIVRAELQRRYNRAHAKLTALATITDERLRAKSLAEIAQFIFGRSFKVYPEFMLHNAADYGLSLNNPNLLSAAGPFAIDEWMQGVSRVRKEMNAYRKLMLVSESVTGRAFTNHDVVQFPIDLSGADSWVGLELPSGYAVAGDTLSMVMELPSGYVPNQPQAGILVDEWTESIPMVDVTAGIAMNYDNPNNEAPQSLLLAVSPELKGRWLWNDLMDTLNETLEMAKKRAIEPDMIQATILSQVLPGIMAPVNSTSAAPGLDFGRNIVQAPAGQDGPILITDYVVQVIDDTNLQPN